MKILIKGAGDLATGIAVRLHHCGYPILMTEIEEPLTVRRMVAFSRAVYEGEAVVEGITGVPGTDAGRNPKSTAGRKDTGIGRSACWRSVPRISRMF